MTALLFISPRDSHPEDPKSSELSSRTKHSFALIIIAGLSNLCHDMSQKHHISPSNDRPRRLFDIHI
jgi:hypothetical protein